MDGRAGVWPDKGGGTNVCEPSLKQLILSLYLMTLKQKLSSENKFLTHKLLVLFRVFGLKTFCEIFYLFFTQKDKFSIRTIPSILFFTQKVKFSIRTILTVLSKTEEFF